MVGKDLANDRWIQVRRGCLGNESGGERRLAIVTKDAKNKWKPNYLYSGIC